jgi:hypothetical protein
MTPVPDPWLTPVPGTPYTVFLRRGWYTPREQKALAKLGFLFTAPNAWGNAEPSLCTVSLPDMPVSALLERLQPLGLTLSVSRAKSWYGRRLRKEDIFWYLCLHHEEDL